MEEVQTHKPEPELEARAHLALETLVEEAWNLRDDDPTRAQTLVENLLEQSVRDPFSRALGLTVQAYLSFREARYDIALEHALKAKVLLNDRASLIWRARLLNTLANTYLMLGERSLSLETYYEQLACAQKSESQVEIFTAYHDLGVYFAFANNHLRALEFYEKAGRHLPADARDRAFLERNLGDFYAELGAFDKAELHAKAALELSGGMLRLVENALRGLAYIATKQNDHAKALRLYRKLLKLQTEGGLATEPTFLDVAESQLALGKVQNALDSLTRTLEYLERGGSKGDLARAHRLLSEGYKGIGDFKRALGHYERFHSYHKAVFNESSETRVRALEIMHRMESLRQESERLKQKNESLERHNQALQELHERVYELSIRDALTGLYNRRYLFEQLEKILKLAKRYAYPLSVAMLDIDNFKEVNDTFGHKMGDAVLQRVGELLRQTLRETDITARYGGEEFSVVMPNTPLEDAAMTCERLRQLISEYEWNDLHPALRVTVSIGLASSSALGPGDDEDLFGKADEQLYLAKRSGRDRLRF